MCDYSGPIIQEEAEASLAQAQAQAQGQGQGEPSGKGGKKGPRRPPQRFHHVTMAPAIDVAILAHLFHAFDATVRALTTDGMFEKGIRKIVGTYTI